MSDEVCEHCRPAFERLEKKVEELGKYMQFLELQLGRFVNPHTPPSFARNYKKQKNDSPKGIPGQKPGHEGRTRKTPDPDRHITALARRCVNCNSPLSSPFSYERRLIEDIQPPPPPIVTEFLLGVYECAACGARTVATHPQCPKEGSFGNNALALSAIMKNELRLPYRTICYAFGLLYGLDMTAATALDMNRRVADALEPQYDEIRRNIRDADVVYGDETGAPMDGANRWNWAFSTQTDVLFAIRDSRGSDVPEEILGNEFDGAMVNDGWKPYGEYAHKHGLQMGRCWSHLLREADDLAERFPKAQRVADKLHEILKDLVDGVRRNPSEQARKRLHANGMNRLRRLSRKRFRKPEAKRFMKKLERARIDLMTFVLVPGMEPTNNRSERNLREQVIQRKISRTFRSEKGIMINERIMSAFATWHARKWNCYEELLKRLT